MSHTRFALGFPRNRKIASLSDSAFRLWVSAIDYAREQATDGQIASVDLDLIPRCPASGKARDALTGEMERSGLWLKRDGGWQIHDFLDWQDSSKEVRAKRERARERMRRVRANTTRTFERTDGERSPETSGEQKGERSREVRSGLCLLSSSSDLKQDQPDRSGKPDPFLDSLTGQLTHQRPDVQRVFAGFAETFGYHGAKLTRGDVRAQQIAERIDASGEASCLLVVKYAPQDGMVSGKADDRGQKHERIEYIFGNVSAFERILRFANEREGTQKRRRSASELLREAQNR